MYRWLYTLEWSVYFLSLPLLSGCYEKVFDARNYILTNIFYLPRIGREVRVGELGVCSKVARRPLLQTLLRSPLSPLTPHLNVVGPGRSVLRNISSSPNAQATTPTTNNSRSPRYVFTCRRSERWINIFWVRLMFPASVKPFT